MLCRLREEGFFLSLFFFLFSFSSLFYFARAEGGSPRRKMRRPLPALSHTCSPSSSSSLGFSAVVAFPLASIRQLGFGPGHDFFSRRAGGSALRAVTASAGNAQEKYGGCQMVEPCSVHTTGRHRKEKG